jgi:hypothetical protein
MNKYKPEPITNSDHLLEYWISELVGQLKELNRHLSAPVSQPKTVTRKKKESDES